MRKLSWLLSFFLCLSTAYASPNLQEFLTRASEGDYVVAEAMKMFTLIRVRSLGDKAIVLEEISGPSKNLPDRAKTSWEEWVQTRADGHSSWSLIEISLEDGKILDSYSFSRNTRIMLSQKESLLASLLQRPLKEVPLENRRRVGPPPMDGEADFRKAWVPPLTIEGKKINSPQVDVFETTWPEDGSELGGRIVSFYFDHELRTAFPIWIEVETSHITGKFRVIDAGKDLSSPYRRAPKQAILDQIN